MRQVLMALVLVAGCGAGSDQTQNGAAPKAEAAVDTASLNGLYESGAPPQPNQICMVGGDERQASFGLVAWGENLHSCSGSGRAVREGDKLTLTMAGDERCTIDAKIDGGTITLPATVPEGCSYYCGARARLGSASFVKKGSRLEDAMKAKDLVGEPLCSGLG